MDTTDIIYNCAQKLDCDARRFGADTLHLKSAEKQMFT